MKIKFLEDKFYNGQVKYAKDVVHEIGEDEAVRWLRRGGIQVKEEIKEEEVKEEIKPEVKEETKHEVKAEVKPKEKHAKKKTFGL